jgi:hypothetical protein
MRILDVNNSNCQLNPPAIPAAIGHEHLLCVKISLSVSARWLWRLRYRYVIPSHLAPLSERN